MASMRTVGLLGGMTFEATALYYSIINKQVRSTLGSEYSAPLLLHSFNFHPLLKLMQAGAWDEVTRTFVSAAKGLEAAGAEGLVICANFPHKVAEEVEGLIKIPLLHIADFTGQAIKDAGARKVGLLGAKAVMEQPYIKGRISQKFGIEVLVPEEQVIRDAIHQELMATLPSGKVTPEIRTLLIQQAQSLVSQGAEGIILGSTDLGFALKEGDVNVPLFDTNYIHAKGIAEWVLGETRVKE